MNRPAPRVHVARAMKTNDSGIEDAAVWRAKILRALAELRGGHQDGRRGGDAVSRDGGHEHGEEDAGAGSSPP